MAQNTDIPALFRDAFALSIRSENIAPLLVDGLIVVALGSCSLGIALPALLRGYTAMAMRITRGEPVAIGDSLKGFEHFASSLVLGLLVLGAAVVLSILPVIGTSAGLILGSWVWCLHVEDPSRGAIETFKASVAIVSANLFDTVIVWLVTVFLALVLTATVIGSVLGLGFGVMVTALMYRQIARVN